MPIMLNNCAIMFTSVAASFQFEKGTPFPPPPPGLLYSPPQNYFSKNRERNPHAE